MENVDFVTTVNGQQIVIENITEAEAKKNAQKIEEYADAIAKANNDDC